MEQFYETLSKWVDQTAYAIWSWLTIKTRFIQFGRLGDGFKLIFAGFLGKKARGRP